MSLLLKMCCILNCRVGLSSSLFCRLPRNWRDASAIRRGNAANHTLRFFASPEKLHCLNVILITFNLALWSDIYSFFLFPLLFFFLFRMREMMMHFSDLLRCFQSRTWAGNSQTYKAAFNLLSNYVFKKHVDESSCLCQIQGIKKELPQISKITKWNRGEYNKISCLLVLFGGQVQPHPTVSVCKQCFSSDAADIHIIRLQ